MPKKCWTCGVKDAVEGSNYCDDHFPITTTTSRYEDGGSIGGGSQGDKNLGDVGGGTAPNDYSEADDGGFGGGESGGGYSGGFGGGRL